MGKETVLVYGASASAHCMADEYAESPDVKKVILAPGNPGIAYTIKGKRGFIECVPIRDFGEVANFCQENKVSLVDVASEDPLDKGLVDILEEAGIPAVGPKSRYVRLENDREFTDKLLSEIGKERFGNEYAIKPEWKSFTNPTAAKQYVRNIGYQVVVKANGLAAGKGVIICDDVEDAEAAIETIMVKRKFGDAGEKVIIEERKYGTEISFFTYLDGRHVLPLKMFAQDYKQACDPEDQETIKQLGGNPNTGGMGSYCPHKLVSPHLVNRIIKDIVNPTVDKIYNKLGWNYKGVLYFGLNLDPYQNLSVFEYNVRLGDPEAEVLLRKLQTNLFEIGMATWEGNLDKISPIWNNNHYVDVILTTGRSKDGKGGWYPGYPSRYGEGYKITGLEHLENRTLERGVTVFFSGVDEHPERGLVTKGGRVFHIVASGKTLEEAASKAYIDIENFEILDHNNEGKDCKRYRKTIGRL